MIRVAFDDAVKLRVAYRQLDAVELGRELDSPQQVVPLEDFFPRRGIIGALHAVERMVMTVAVPLPSTQSWPVWLLEVTQTPTS